MKEKVEKILDLMLTGLQNVGDIAQTELPKLVEDYVRYFIIQEIPLMSLAIFLFGIVLFIFTVKMAKSSKTFRDEIYDELGLLYLIAFCGMVIVPGAIFLTSLKDTMSLVYAPKAALIERFRK